MVSKPSPSSKISAFGNQAPMDSCKCRVDQQNDAGLHPYMERSVEHFGVDCIVWGGDWPVCILAKGPGNWIDISTLFLKG